VADDIVTRLQDTAYETDLCWEAADEIERLRAALRLAAVEVYGSCDPLTTSPDDLARHFYEEARRG
jgi:hypothetical protein